MWHFSKAVSNRPVWPTFWRFSANADIGLQVDRLADFLAIFESICSILSLYKQCKFPYVLIQRFLIFFWIFLTEMKSFRSRVDRAKGDASEKILVKVQNDKYISLLCRKSSKFLYEPLYQVTIWILYKSIQICGNTSYRQKPC